MTKVRVTCSPEDAPRYGICSCGNTPPEDQIIDRMGFVTEMSWRCTSCSRWWWVRPSVYGYSLYTPTPEELIELVARTQ